MFALIEESSNVCPYQEIERFLVSLIRCEFKQCRESASIPNQIYLRHSPVQGIGNSQSDIF